MKQLTVPSNPFFRINAFNITKDGAGKVIGITDLSGNGRHLTGLNAREENFFGLKSITAISSIITVPEAELSLNNITLVSIGANSLAPPTGQYYIRLNTPSNVFFYANERLTDFIGSELGLSGTNTLRSPNESATQRPQIAVSTVAGNVLTIYYGYLGSVSSSITNAGVLNTTGTRSLNHTISKNSETSFCALAESIVYNRILTQAEIEQCFKYFYELYPHYYHHNPNDVQNNRQLASNRIISTNRILHENDRILSKFDFTSNNFKLGDAGTVSHGLYYWSKANNRYVQTSETTVVNSIATDHMSTGKLLNSSQKGLVLDSQVTNLLTNPRTLVGWSAEAPGTGGSFATGFTGPDGLPYAWKADVRSVGYTKYLDIPTRVAANLTYTGWTKTDSGTTQYSRFRWYTGATNYLASDDAALLGRVLTSTWTRQQRTIDTGFPATTKVYSWFQSKAGAITGQYTAANTVEIGDLPMITTSKIPTEFYEGFLTGTTFGLFSTLVINDSNNISMELEFYPRVSSNIYGTVYIFRLNATNYCTYDGSTGRFNVVINSVSYSPPESITWTNAVLIQTILQSQNRVRLWVKCGWNTNTQIQFKLNDNSTIVLTPSTSPQALPTFAGNIGILSDLAGPNAGQLSSHLLCVTNYKALNKPDWAS